MNSVATIKNVNRFIIHVIILVVLATCITPFIDVYADDDNSNQTKLYDWLPEWVEGYLKEARIEKVTGGKLIYDPNTGHDIYELQGFNKDHKAVYIKIENNNKESTPLGETSESGNITVLTTNTDYDESIDYNYGYFRFKFRKEEKGSFETKSYKTLDGETVYSVQISSKIQTVDQYEDYGNAGDGNGIADKMQKNSSVDFTISNNKIENLEITYSYTYESNELKGIARLLSSNRLEDSPEHRRMVGGRIITKYSDGSDKPTEKIIFYPNGTTETYSLTYGTGNPYTTYPTANSYIYVRTKSVDKNNTYEGYYDAATNDIYKVKWTQKNSDNSSTTIVLYYDTTNQGLDKVTVQKYEGGEWIEEDISETFFADHDELDKGDRWNPFDGWYTSKMIRSGIGGGAPWKRAVSQIIRPTFLCSSKDFRVSLLTTALIRGDISPAEYAKFNGASAVEATIFAVQYNVYQRLCEIKKAIINSVNKFINHNNYDYNSIYGKINGKWSLVNIDKLQ